MLIKSELSSFYLYWSYLYPNKNWINWKHLPEAIKNYFSLKKERRLYSVTRWETWESFTYIYRYLNNMLDMYGKDTVACPLNMEFETWRNIIFEMRDLAKKLAEDDYENNLDRQIDKDTFFDWLKEYIYEIWW